MGRHTKPHTGKPYKPTDEQRRHVLSMVGLGIRHEDVATMLRIDHKTLSKHFRRELDTGMIEADMRVAQSLYTNATKHMNVTAQIWWTKTRMGWKEPSTDVNIANTVRYVIMGMPEIEDPDEWLKQCAPKQIAPA